MNTTKKAVSFKGRLIAFFSGLVPLFILAHFMHHIPGLLIQPLSPYIRDALHLDYSQVAWLSSAYTFSYGLSNLPAGWLGGRIAPRLLITIGVVGVAIGGLMAGLSTNYLMLIIAMLLIGILGGGYHSSASPIISDATPPEKRGSNLGLHQIGGTAANIIVPLFAAALVGLLTWRGLYILAAILAIPIGLYLYTILKRRHLGDVPPKVQVASGNIPISKKINLRRMIAFVAMGAAVQVFITTAFNFVPLLVVDKFHGTEWLGAAILSVGHIAGLAAGPVGGNISDKLGKVPVMLAVSLAAGPIIFLLALGTHWWLLPMVLLALGACMYVAMPVTESYVISNVSTRNSTSVLGIYYFISRGGPAVLLPVIGKLLDSYSFSVAFTAIGAALFAVTLICSLLLWGTKD
jgi:FSR family fosmidomycin resistance protein-like MFS transporter